MGTIVRFIRTILVCYQRPRSSTWFFSRRIQLIFSCESSYLATPSYRLVRICYRTLDGFTFTQRFASETVDRKRKIELSNCPTAYCYDPSVSAVFHQSLDVVGFCYFRWHHLNKRIALYQPINSILER